MARHRIVRTMDYNDEYDGYDDVYGHSVDDDSCISPTDAQQWLYDRARGQQSISAFIRNNKNIQEEGEINDRERDEDAAYEKSRRDSDNFQMPLLNELEQAKLTSCIEEVRNVVGDMISERHVVETSMRFSYDISKILDEILNDGYESNKILQKNTITLPAVQTATKAAASFSLNPKILKVETEREKPKANVRYPQGRDALHGSYYNFPILESLPTLSGRNTPADTSEEYLKNGGVGNIFKVSKDQAQRNAQELFMTERSAQKIHFNMIVIGHVDAGKSTLMGHLLYDMGNVSTRVMHKHEQESKKIGKQSFMYAWILDETGEERERGITMDVGQSHIETESKIVTLLDAPGHKDFIPNMISGATQADTALLVVDATRGEFETGFEQGGQTREHALLVRSLGVTQMGVVINKLDTVKWSETRFDEIVKKLKIFLKQAGFKEPDITYVPCSGLIGENLTQSTTQPELKSWYNGPHLLNVIDNFKISKRAVDRPFRMSVSDIFKGAGSGFNICGRIETGALCLNDKVLVGASREQAQVKGLLIDELQQIIAFAGDQVSITLAGVDMNIGLGCMIYDPQYPMLVTSRFQGRILVFNLKVPLTIGFPVILHYQSLIEPAAIIKLVAQIHKNTGEVMKKKPRCLDNNSCALVEIETTRPICIEKYADYKNLGRFMLRVGGVTIAAGMVTKTR